jgi:hypothetical protein
VKKIISIALLLAVCATAAIAGRFGLGVGLGFFKPAEEGSSYTPIYNANAYYWLNRHVVPSLGVGYARYTIGDTTYSYMPIIPRVTYHFRTKDWLDPYAGAGVVYARRWSTGGVEITENTWGYTGLVGVDLSAGRYLGIGLGVEYVVPDAGNFDTAYPGFIIGFGLGSM